MGELKDVNVRSLVFAALMTTVVLDDYTEETDKFMDEIDDNSCNFILSNDIAPRLYGYTNFVKDFLDDGFINLAVGDKKAHTKLGAFLIRRSYNWAVDGQKNRTKESEWILSIVNATNKYVHPGKIIYYETKEAKPKVLKDVGFGYDGPNKENTFRSVTYRPGEMKGDPFDKGL